MDIFYFIVQNSFLFIIPLLIVALGGMFSEKGGVVNIALEGIMLMGGFVSCIFLNIMQKNNSNIPPQILLLLAIIIAGASGALFSLLHAFASINMKADQVISGTALNLLAPALAIFLARIFRGVQQIPVLGSVFKIKEIPLLSKIPLIGPMFFQNVYLTTYLGIAILLISAFVIKKTKFGLRLKACGEHPQAADSVGINVYKIRYMGVLISGFLAGIGGLIFVITTSTEYNADVASYGFLALAVLIFGQWKPSKILLAAIFFGVMKSISASWSVIPGLSSLKISDYIYKMIPFIATLIALMLTSKKSIAPKASGKPYDKGER